MPRAATKKSVKQGLRGVRQQSQKAAPKAAVRKLPLKKPRVISKQKQNRKHLLPRLPLPSEILLKVLRFLPFNDLTSYLLVSRQFNGVISQNRKRLQQLDIALMFLHVDERERYVEIHLERKSPTQFWHSLRIKKDQWELTFNQNRGPALHMIHDFLPQRGSVEISQRKKDNCHNKIICKTNDQLTEIKAAMDFVLKNFKIRKVKATLSEAADDPKLSDWVIEAVKAVKFDNTAVAKVEMEYVSPYFIQLYQCLRCKMKYWDRTISEEELLQLDTSFNIEISVAQLTMQELTGLYKDWHAGNRRIKHISFKGCSNITLDDAKKFMESSKRIEESNTIAQEAGNVWFLVERPFDNQRLHLSYEITTKRIERRKVTFYTLILKEIGQHP